MAARNVPQGGDNVRRLHRAAKDGDCRTLEILLNSGVAVDARASGDSGYPDGCDRTALHTAVLNGQDAAVALLIASGADVNARDGGGITVLSFAAANGFIDIVKALLSAGADVNARDDDGWTAELGASEGDHDDIVDVLKAWRQKAKGEVVDLTSD